MPNCVAQVEPQREQRTRDLLGKFLGWRAAVPAAAQLPAQTSST